MKKGNIFIAASLFCIALIYFFPVIFSSQTFASRDIYIFFNPRRFFAAETIRNGTIPLWNPYLASGVPFLANLQSSIFYPLSIIYYILPFQLGFKYFIILHYYLAGLFMYLLMRQWRYDTYSSLISAIAFMFGGYMISILDNVAFLTSAVWLPLIMLFFDRYLREGKLGYLVITGIIVGLQILGGDASFYVLSTFIMMSTYLLYYLVAEKPPHFRKKYKTLLAIPIAWLIGLSLSSIQLIPFIEFVYHSTRMEGFSFEKIAKWSLHPLELMQLLVPYFYGTTVPLCRWFGQLWLDTIYLGILPLLLVMFNLWYSRNKLNVFLLIIIFFSLFMALGEYNPIFSWCQYIPIINMIQFPVKFFFLASFSLALMTGMGCSSLFDKLMRREEIKGFSVFLLMMNVFFIAILLVGSFMENVLFDLFKGIYPQNYFCRVVGVGPSFVNIFNGYSQFVILLTTVSILMMLAIRGKIAVRSLKIAFLVILLFDLFFLGKPKDNTIQSSLYARPNETVEWIRSDSLPFRIFSLAYVTYGNLFMNIPKTRFAENFKTLQDLMIPNLSVYFHMDTIDEYAAILVKRYYLLLSPLKEFFRLKQKEPWQINYCKEVLGLLNVKYLISPFGLSDMDFKLIKDGDVKIYENQSVLPRVRLVPKAIVLKSDEEVLKTIQELNLSPSESILINKEEYNKAQDDFEGGENVPLHAFKGSAKILKYSENRVEIETECNDSSFLVLADNHYPGWKVYVNGIKKNVLRVNYNMRGVILPKGDNKVEFSYEPLSFKIGVSLSLLSLFFIITFFLIERGITPNRT